MIINDFNKISSFWDKNKADVNIYINSPFCATKCSYCVYSGLIHSKEQERDQYFSCYLPNQIKKYKNIIFKNNISSIYYGGGTPNFPNELYRLGPIMDMLNDIPSVSNAEKVIELHTGIKISDEDINFLADHDINTVILCIQTFDEVILSQCNRLHTYVNDINNLISKFHEKNIKVGIDLISFSCMKTQSDNIYNDLDIISHWENLPDEITISNEYSIKTKSLSKGSFFKIKEIPLISNYYTPEINLNNISREELYYRNTFRFFLKKDSYEEYKNNNFFKFINSLDETESTPKSIIGIGSYKQEFKWVYSRVSGICSYYEINNNLDNDPTYELCEFNLFKQAHNLLNWVEKTLNDNNIPMSPTMNININFKDSRPEGHNANVSGNYNINFNITDIQENLAIDKLNEDLKNKGIDNILH